MDTTELETKISDSLREFHRRRLQAAQNLRVLPLLRRKNPYLYRSLGIEIASDLMKTLLESHLKESEETIFGDAFFEPLALLASGGTVSPTEGVDVVVETDTKYLAIAVKSGPNIFSSSQKRRQNTEFNALRSRLLKTQKAYDPLLGHAYGRLVSGPNEKKNYRDSSGQAFWEELTGDPDFYLKLIRLMKDEPLKYKEQFDKEWAAIINRLTAEFTEFFCSPDGHIDWERLTEFVSAKKKPAVKKLKS